MSSKIIFYEDYIEGEPAQDVRVRDLTLVEARLAANAGVRRDYPSATKWLALALNHADSLVARPQAGVDAVPSKPIAAAVDIDQLRVLWLAAELYTLDQVAPIY